VGEITVPTIPAAPARESAAQVTHAVKTRPVGSSVSRQLGSKSIAKSNLVTNTNTSLESELNEIRQAFRA